jgi:hypothetical protein
MKNPFRNRIERQVTAKRQVRQEQAAAYDPNGDINFNLRRADDLRNTPAARKARAKLKSK